MTDRLPAPGTGGAVSASSCCFMPDPSWLLSALEPSGVLSYVCNGAVGLPARASFLFLTG